MKRLPLDGRYLAPEATPELPALAEGQALPEWLHLVPFGSWVHPQAGPFTVGPEQAAQIVANFARGGIDLAIDHEHQTLNTLFNGAPAPAWGWIDRLEARPDGVWGHIKEWTPRGEQALRNREYRYLSPVLVFETLDRVSGESTGCSLMPPALTNVPFLQSDLVPVLQRIPTATHPEAPTMTPLLIVTLLGLSAAYPTPSEEDAKKALEGAKDALACRDGVRMELGLPAEVTTEDILAATTADRLFAEVGQAACSKMGWKDSIPADAKAKVTAELEHVGYVPMSQHAAALARIDSASGASAEQDNARIVEQAMEAGKLTAAMRTWFEGELAKGGAHRTAALSWLQAAPVVVPMRGTRTPVRQPPGSQGATQLSASELAVCRQLGMKPEDYAAQKAAGASV